MTGQLSSIVGLRPRTAASGAADRRNTALRSAVLDLPLTAAFGPILFRLGATFAMKSGTGENAQLTRYHSRYRYDT